MCEMLGNSALMREMGVSILRSRPITRMALQGHLLDQLTMEHLDPVHWIPQRSCSHSSTHCRVHASMQAGTQGGEEEARLQLTLEYMSGAVAQEASDPNLGRHLLLPLQLRILPSVQVHLSHFLISCKDQVQQPSIYMLSLMLLVVQLSLWTFSAANGLFILHTQA